MAGSALIREMHIIRPAIPTLLVSGYVGVDLLPAMAATRSALVAGMSAQALGDPA